jgi:hypothetical protein
VSGLPVARHHDHRASSRREHVLAVWLVRRGLERCATGSGIEGRPHMAVSVCELTRDLEELIAALDRRVRRVEQAGEADIARDAAALRAKAVTRLAELTGTRLPTATMAAGIIGDRADAAISHAAGRPGSMETTAPEEERCVTTTAAPCSAGDR